MANPQTAEKYYSIEEYLKIERADTEKHEYYKSEIFAMSGATLRHNRIQMNFVVAVGNYLKGKTCDIFGSDLRVHIPHNTLFTYPDALIVCDKPELLDNQFDTILNPTVIVEILSKSKQNFNRRNKFKLYRDIPSLREYILINSEAFGVEHYTKQTDATWVLEEVSQPSAVLHVSSISFSLPLTELYNGVVF